MIIPKLWGPKMPVKTNDTEDKKNEIEERVRNYPCWKGFLMGQDMYEEINGERELIGSFALCLRRKLPKMPDYNLSELKKRDYKTNQCDICQYEWTGKWPKSILLETKKIWDEDTKIERKVPITNLKKSAIIAAIKQYIENGVQGDLIIKHGKTLPAPETNEIDEVPF